MKTVYLILLFSVCFFSSCNKDDVPSIDEENTFSCKINGKVFIPKEHGGFPNSFHGILNTVSPTSDWTFTLSDGETTLYLYLHNVLNIGEYNLSESDGNGDFFGEEKNVMELITDGAGEPTHKSIIDSGKVNVTFLELDNKIILKFDEIVLTDISNPNSNIQLSEGKLNINRKL